MKNVIMAILFSLMLSAGAMAQGNSKDKSKDKPKEQQPAAAPQPAVSQPTIAQVLDRQLSTLEKDFVPAAEPMPEDKFNFAPTISEFTCVRTLALQPKHAPAHN